MHPTVFLALSAVRTSPTLFLLQEDIDNFVENWKISPEHLDVSTDLLGKLNGIGWFCAL